MKEESRLADPGFTAHQDRCAGNDSPTEYTIELTDADGMAVTLARSFCGCTDDRCRRERFSKRWLRLEDEGLLSSALWTETHPPTGAIGALLTAIGEFLGSGTTFHGNKGRP
jgi:hypothetical protein